MPFSILSPTIHEKQEFTSRALTRRDLPELWELLQVINRVDDNDYYEALDDLERQYDDPRSNPKTDARVFRTLAGKLVAFARLFTNPQPTKQNIAWQSCEIVPEARGQGLEQECLEWMEERATERLAETAQAEGASDLPRVLRADFLEASDRIPLYQARGYQHVRTSYQMERDLSQPIPENPLPVGLTLHTFTDEIAEPLRLAFNDAFQNNWGHQPSSAQAWQAHVIEVSDFRRDLTLIVRDGNEIAAFCICYDNTADNERRGIQRSWVGMVGTRRAYRKRGIASALLAEAMRRFRADGFAFVGLDVDTENVSGALALYEGLGFKAYKTRVVLEKIVG